MKLNQKGITLVELLAALVLVSLVAGIAWTALSIGFKHTAVETNKTSLQQDANLIVSTLSAAHRRNDTYTLKFDANKQLMIKTCEDITACPATSTFTRVIDNNYDYTDTTINGAIYDGGTFPEVVVKPKENHTELVLKIKSLNNTVTVKTTLTRIITGMK
ncbi:prepilin-type N-terminal cleavage/methylation domain-containing protein [Planococcus shenhongbingii]|uniref:prepilin-type N-terminal cleavage/methylation domain-containing protein n=1 Tax=Planococcus shenhongbingii TaxID=3058398 RepID=UPI00262F4F7D|nr:prepilin-type N-terminal cleavage/methylation domain-containing protein [Planococcus sp. N016]WKA60000.1 prepilin-type N-terminal cleavage/methylation domain-containing protein [Planococcus sp. N016]